MSVPHSARKFAAVAVARSAASALARLPPGVSRHLVEALPAERAFDALQAAARKCNVSDIRVIGDYGPIEGSIDDSAIMRSYAITRSWRPRETRFFTELFAAHRKGTFIDIGANVGLTTIPIARNPDVACKAFEPEPRNFAYLSRNIAANCPTADVELFNFALFDRAAMLDIELSRSNMGDHRVRLGGSNEPREPEGTTVIKVPGKPLDDVLDPARLQHPVGVKISVQGAESRIVMGGKTVLGHATAMVVEFYPFLINLQRADPEPVLAFCGEQFHAGALMKAGEGRDPVWQPVAEVAGTLRHLLRPGGAGEYDYFQLLVVQKDLGKTA